MCGIRCGSHVRNLAEYLFVAPVCWELAFPRTPSTGSMAATSFITVQNMLFAFFIYEARLLFRVASFRLRPRIPPIYNLLAGIRSTNEHGSRCYTTAYRTTNEGSPHTGWNRSRISSIRIDVLVRAVIRVSVAVEATARVGIRRDRINAQEWSTRHAFVVGEPVSPRPFKDLAQVFAGGLCVKSEFFPRRDSGSRTRARQAVSLSVY